MVNAVAAGQAAGLGPLRQELEARTSGAAAGDVNGGGTIDFDTFDAALQATGHRMIRHQVQGRCRYAHARPAGHKLLPNNTSGGLVA
jgi:hypothetical protein